MGTFPVVASLADPRRPERRLTLELLVETGGAWTVLPAEVAVP